MMHITDLGPEDAPCVLLCHGSGAPPASLDPLPLILSQDYRVLTPHFPGYGETMALEPYDFEQGVRMLADALDDLGITTVIAVGHSFGLYRVERLLSLWPGRITRVIGLAGIASFPEDAREAYEGVAEWARADVGIAEGLAARWFTEEYLASHADIVKEVQSWWNMCDIETVCAELFVPMDGGLHDRLISESNVPFDLLCGSRDQVVPPELSSSIEQLGVHVTLNTVEGSGHFLHIEAPEETLTFLRARLGK